ncbi:MAG TPA: hypothetical protein VN408_41955 [Actinoplanes sp.]|nr:hypothetical protein [Actinoplanes sp.]
MSPALTSRVREVAPGNSDLASAGTSAAFNLGIAAGAGLGGLALSRSGLPATAPIGGMLVLAALVLAIIDPRLATITEPAPADERWQDEGGTPSLSARQSRWDGQGTAVPQPSVCQWCPSSGGEFSRPGNTVKSMPLRPREQVGVN